MVTDGIIHGSWRGRYKKLQLWVTAETLFTCISATGPPGPSAVFLMPLMALFTLLPVVLCILRGPQDPIPHGLFFSGVDFDNIVGHRLFYFVL